MGERLQSILRSLKKEGILKSAFNKYVYGLALGSLIGTVILFVSKIGFLFVDTFTGKNEPYNEQQWLWLCISFGVVLISGMVHTEYTIPGIQFAAYGFLIVAMALQTILNVRGGNMAELWIAFIFVVCFSMAIPVVYETKLSNHLLFHIVEALVSLVTIYFFVTMLLTIFIQQGDYSYPIAIMLLTAVGDALVIGLRWKEEKNWFVLVSVVLATVFYLVGFIMKIV